MTFRCRHISWSGRAALQPFKGLKHTSSSRAGETRGSKAAREGDGGASLSMSNRAILQNPCLPCQLIFFLGARSCEGQIPYLSVAWRFKLPRKAAYRKRALGRLLHGKHEVPAAGHRTSCRVLLRLCRQGFHLLDPPHSTG